MEPLTSNYSSLIILINLTILFKLLRSVVVIYYMDEFGNNSDFPMDLQI